MSGGSDAADVTLGCFVLVGWLLAIALGLGLVIKLWSSIL